MNAREVNFDGLVGLTHHYAGLSFGIAKRCCRQICADIIACLII